MIDVVNVWHHYGIRPVLRDVSLRIETGEVVVVMGPNGMGKSTLLAIIGGAMSTLRGYVEIDGLRRRRSVEEENQVRKRIVYLPDNPWLPMGNTGREFLLAVGRIYRIDEERLMQHIGQLLEVFDLTKQGDSPIQSYSTGQRKKIGICSALVAETPILVLDEPFSGGLDSSALLALTQILKQIAQAHDTTVIVAVPVPELVEPLAHRIAIIKEGQIVAYDTVEGLKRQAGVDGPLPEAIERIVHPEGADTVARYLAERR